jgi:hypothetical protein
MAKKGLQPVDNDEDLEDSMSEDEVAAGAGGGASESEEEEEEQEWEPWLAPVISDETATPARVTFYGQGDGKVMQDGWERVKVGHASNCSLEAMQACPTAGCAPTLQPVLCLSAWRCKLCMLAININVCNCCMPPPMHLCALQPVPACAPEASPAGCDQHCNH